MDRRELTERYGIDAASVEAFVRRGLIPREDGAEGPAFGPAAETAVKKILILRGVGLGDEQIAEALADPELFDENFCGAAVRSLRATVADPRERERLIRYAGELRGGDPGENGALYRLMSLLVPGMPEVAAALVRQLTLVLTEATGAPDWLPDEYRVEQDDLSVILSRFLEDVGEAYDEGEDYDGPGAQDAVEQLCEELGETFGLLIHLGAGVCTHAFADLMEERTDPEDVDRFGYWMEVFVFCADWCGQVMALDRIRDREAFESWLGGRLNDLILLSEEADHPIFPEGPEAFRRRCRAMYDTLCALPGLITPELLDAWEAGVNEGAFPGFREEEETWEDEEEERDEEEDEEEQDEEEREAVRDFLHYVVQALKAYLRSHPSGGA